MIGRIINRFSESVYNYFSIILLQMNMTLFEVNADMAIQKVVNRDMQPRKRDNGIKFDEDATISKATITKLPPQVGK